MPAAARGAPPDDRRRDDGRPDPDVRLGQHDRRGARSVSQSQSDGAPSTSNRTPAARAGLSDPNTIVFSEAQLAEVRRLQALYPDTRGALLPVLHMAQETFGYISLEAEEYVATLFDLSPAHVHEVVTFYTLYFRERPGRHVVAVCHNLSCHLAGAPGIVAHLRQRLGIDPGETTDDGRVTFLTVECLCACEAAPMMQVDDRYEMNLTPAKLDQILRGLA
ncbi:MAG: NAD(P)H-dependent oxidoreductase subunit E [Candidatus Rokuibacteriota bacterium]|nr:MAG: NAD(P)H-dependent oxidoreductase subunit E [Candidatus Rokubacteria bacterium]PYO11605.1 MAG: NAD(P)H-dependent oxidoreductase subunit E [Candidatus Rokubacteria bacterium]